MERFLVANKHNGNVTLFFLTFWGVTIFFVHTMTASNNQEEADEKYDIAVDLISKAFRLVSDFL